MARGAEAGLAGRSGVTAMHVAADALPARAGPSLDASATACKARCSGWSSPELRDLLHGTWLGHPLHPVLVQVPVGAFMSAAVLDLLPGQRQGRDHADRRRHGRRRAGRRRRPGRLVRADPGPAPGRPGARRRQHRRARPLCRLAGGPASPAGSGWGKALAFAGLSVAGAGAYLGGHLSYEQGARDEPRARRSVLRLPGGAGPTVGELAALPDGKPTVRTIGDVPVLLYRPGDRVTAMIERCCAPERAARRGRGRGIGRRTPAWSARGTAAPSGSPTASSCTGRRPTISRTLRTRVTRRCASRSPPLTHFRRSTALWHGTRGADLEPRETQRVMFCEPAGKRARQAN